MLTALTLTAAGGGVGFWAGRSADFQHLTAAFHPEKPVAAGDVAGTAATLDRNTPGTEGVAARLGEVEAELMRLNALGERLSGMAGLDPAEFDFSNPPPQGGPEEAAARDYTIREIASELGSVVSLLKDRKRKLELLEEAIPGRELAGMAVPAGWPIRSGYITSEYGMRVHPVRHRRMFHQGVDFAAHYGEPVVAVADGVVTFSGRRNGYGNLVEIRHSNGYSTRYGHNSANLVQEGQQVHQGQRIASVGATGTATGPHVHFEVLKDGEHLNPMPFANRSSNSVLMAYNPG